LLEREAEASIGSWQPATDRRKALELLDAIVACLIYLRHNTVQAALGEQPPSLGSGFRIDFLAPIRTETEQCLPRCTPGPE